MVALSSVCFNALQLQAVILRFIGGLRFSWYILFDIPDELKSFDGSFNTLWDILNTQYDRDTTEADCSRVCETSQ